MAWSDEPTDAQLDTIFRWLNWETPIVINTAEKAVEWLRNTATRKDVSQEMYRLKQLKDAKKLNLDNCFDSEIWEGFLKSQKEV